MTWTCGGWGEIDAPYVLGGPHPQAFPVSFEPGADRVMVTFDDEQYAQDVLGYGTEGNVVVMRALGARRSVLGAGR